MTGLHEAFDDIAAEITPIEPPVDLTMRRGRRVRRGRLTAFAAGTAAVTALVVGAAVGIPALADGPADPAGPASSAASPADRAPLIRPVLLVSGRGAATAFGDASLVNAATMRLFRELSCEPGPDPVAVDDGWKAALGYTAAQWNAPGSEVVSCDAAGNKYVLGKAVVLGSQVTSATPVYVASGLQWGLDVKLNSAGAVAFGLLTTSQFNNYYPDSATNQDDAALDQAAIVLNGDVQVAPETEGVLTSGVFMIQGPQPTGFTQEQATALAARL
jgi:hypothetical protein